MKQIVVFASSGSSADESYTSVEFDVNTWLAQHPRAVLLASHTNMAANETWTEYAITLIVELPEGGATPQEE